VTNRSTRHLDELYGPMKDSGASPKTNRNHHATISSALHLAVRWGWVRDNVPDRARPPPVRQRRGVFSERLPAPSPPERVPRMHASRWSRRYLPTMASPSDVSTPGWAPSVEAVRAVVTAAHGFDRARHDIAGPPSRIRIWSGTGIAGGRVLLPGQVTGCC
jgi:hypothetical protein